MGAGTRLSQEEVAGGRMQAVRHGEVTVGCTEHGDSSVCIQGGRGADLVLTLTVLVPLGRASGFS